ncbi:MAG: Gfo/Idh/MocA family oxidoreductase [Pirellulaceae bacterium]|nr:Gfo/Idh/MocA family oxidoreductase [Pirellulaceae bacterium]
MSDKKVCWGLLSTARINERIIQPIRDEPRSELVAVASRSEKKAEAFAGQWKIPRAYGSYQQLLADNDLDAIYISLPNSLHTEWAVKCADAGKHVLCEKPLALTVEEVNLIEQAAQRNGVVVQEAAMMHFHPQTNYIRQLVADGAIGQVRLLRGVFTYVLDNPQDVRLQPNQGGGSLWDLGSYCVRFMRTVLGQEPQEVLASQVSSDRGVDLSLAAQLHFPSGALAQFYCSFQAFGHVEGDLVGTEGRIQITSPWVNQPGYDAHVHWIRHDGSLPRGTWDDGMLNQTVDTKTYGNTNAYQDEVDSMVASILDNAPPEIPLSDSRQNTAVILALLQSAREHKSVTL